VDKEARPPQVGGTVPDNLHAYQPHFTAVLGFTRSRGAEDTASGIHWLYISTAGNLDVNATGSLLKFSLKREDLKN